MRPLGERGSATAEFAIALPAVGLVLLLGAGALAAGATTVRLQDAAADAARLAARGESDARAVAAVADAVPGARTHLEQRADLVCVTASAASMLGDVSASSCALAGGR
ncbi:Flp pilus assembly protein TadG [Microbacterium ulmi]|nr:TadE family type IV pilus minor pilin [Microbacterium ulmi]NII68552.1 Flp pilus assembly protein TadG [Microbacterium ulmi]